MGIKKISILINILMLLLLEKSVLIIGDNYEEVSSTVFALIDLLHPYKWLSIFIPILSNISMMDFISSPVPFIAGMIIDNTTKNWKMEDVIDNDRRIKKQIEYGGLTVVNINNGHVIWTQDDSITKIGLTHGQNI